MTANSAQGARREVLSGTGPSKVDEREGTKLHGVFDQMGMMRQLGVLPPGT